jgi:WhiB family redox-sensing transcriptional regulator
MFAPDDACGFQHFRPNHDTALFGVRRSNYVPIPTKEITMDWRDKSACLTVDPELFFPVGNTGPALDQIEKAKQVCAQCPVIENCLQYAMETNQDSGVWGGLSEDERRALKRRAARARRAS